MKEYTITHKRHGCYEVCLVYPHGEMMRTEYLTNFRNKKAAKKFVEEHQKGKVKIDPDTCIPTPDFK